MSCATTPCHFDHFVLFYDVSYHTAVYEHYEDCVPCCGTILVVAGLTCFLINVKCGVDILKNILVFIHGSIIECTSLNCNGFISLGLQGSRKSDVLERLYSTSVFFHCTESFWSTSFISAPARLLCFRKFF